MSKITFSINELGPIKNEEVEIPLNSLFLLYGSNIAGKTLFGAVLASLLQVHGVMVNHDELCKLIGARDFIDLASHLVGEEPLGISGIEIIKKDGGTEVSGPATLRELWPNLDPMKRVESYVAAAIINNTLARYYGWKGSELRIKASADIGNAHIGVDGIFPVILGDEISRNRLSKLTISVIGNEKVFGFSLIDPYNEYWNRLSPSARFVRGLLSMRGLHILAGKIGSKLERLYKWLGLVLSKSLELSGFKGLIDLGVEHGDMFLRIGEANIPSDLFSKGLRTLSSIADYLVALGIASANGFATLLFLDEPEASLDTYNVLALPWILGEFATGKTSIVLSTHREDVVVGLEALRPLRKDVGFEVAEFLYNDEYKCFKPKVVEYSEVAKRFNISRVSELEKRTAILREFYEGLEEALRRLAR